MLNTNVCTSTHLPHSPPLVNTHILNGKESLCGFGPYKVKKIHIDPQTSLIYHISWVLMFHFFIAIKEKGKKSGSSWCVERTYQRVRVTDLETSRKLGDFLWFLSSTPTCHKTNCVANKTMLARMGTFMITMVLWNSLLGWKIKNPVFFGYVITTFLWGRGELLRSKDYGGMIFLGGQRGPSWTS